MITSKDNQQIKNILQLMKKARERREQQLFVVEGRKMFLEGLQLGRISKAFFSESYYNEHASDAEMQQKFDFEVVSDGVFNSMAETVTPQGVIALARMGSCNVDELIERSSSLILLENLQDPGNLGTIVRTAEAAGMDGIILSGDSVDIYNPKVIRSTMGAVYRTSFVYVNDLCEVVRNLNASGFVTMAAHLKGRDYYETAQYGKKNAVLIGNEGNGLSDEISACANCLVKIPMEGQAESLNAAVAAALMMYEIKRQKK